VPGEIPTSYAYFFSILAGFHKRGTEPLGSRMLRIFGLAALRVLQGSEDRKKCSNFRIEIEYYRTIMISGSRASRMRLETVRNHSPDTRTTSRSLVLTARSWV
jgi:hypothetical protein